MRNKIAIPLFLLILASVSFASIGMSFNLTSKVWTLNNSDNLPYFINATSGFQVTNDITGFWSHNTLCLKASVTSGLSTSYPIQCLDKLSWTWTNSTDNKTYANLTGIATWGIAKDYSLKVTMEYYLTSKDRRIQMTPMIENKGNKSTDAWVIWRVHDIKINNSKYDNWVRIWNGSQTEYRLNDSLDLSFTNLSQKSFYLHEGTDTNWAQTDWDSGTYSLDIYTNKSEYNAFIDLSFYQGTMATTGATSKKTSSKMYWIDAICTTNVYSYPTAQQNLYQGSSFSFSGYWTGTGTCPRTRSCAARFANYTTYYNLANTGNLSMGALDSNPQTWSNGEDFGGSWTVKGNDINAPATPYLIKVTCDTTLDSATTNVNVSALPPYQCANLGASTTLTANKYGVCYTITANNVNLNCNNYYISGNWSSHPGIIIQGFNNITVRNCRLTNFSSTFYLNNTVNDTFYNNTLYGNNQTTNSFYDNSIGFEMFNTNNITISNSTESNFTINRNGTSNAGGYGFFMYATNTTLLTVQNVSIFNNSGQIHDGETFYNYGYGLVFYNVLNHTYLNNLSFNNMDTILHMGTSLGQDSMVSNISAVNVRGGIVTSFPSQFQDISINTTATSTGFLFSGGSDGSNLTRYNFTGVNASVYESAISMSGSTSYPSSITVSNVVINMSWYGIKLTQANNNKFSNLSINNTNWCVYDKGDGQVFDNITCDWSNNTIYTEIAGYGIFGGNPNTIISNSTLIFHAGKTAVYKSLLSLNVFFINTTANYTNTTLLSSDDNFWVQWYARVNVTDSTGASLTSTVNDTQNSTVGNQTFYGYYSLTPWYLVNDTYYFGVSGKQVYNNHTINVSASGLFNTTSLNITGRDWTINFTLYVPDSCGTITASKTLINDLTSSGTCITFGASNIVLDCNSHSITGSNTMNSYGIYANGKTNISVKNCNVYTYETGIYFGTITNSSILNTLSNSHTIQGVFLEGGSNNSLYTITASYNINGVQLTTSNENSLTDITTNQNTNYGLYLVGSQNNNVTTVSASGNLDGVSLSTSANNNNLTSIISNHNTNYGIILDTVQFNKLTAITTNSNNFGMFISALSLHNTIINLGSNDQSYALYFTSSSNNIIANSTLSSTSKDIYSDSNSQDNTIFNVSFTSSSVGWGSGTNNFTVQWYGRINVTNQTDSLPADVNVSDVNGKSIYSGTLGSSGLSSWLTFTDYYASNTGNTNFNPHSVNASMAGRYLNSTTFSFVGRDYTFNTSIYYTTPTPPTSSCTYSGSGNWIIKFEDLCNITTSQYIYPNNLTFNGSTGYTHLGSSLISLINITANRFFFNISGSALIQGMNGLTWLNGTIGN